MKPHFDRGAFVRCNVPFGERPDKPGPGEHIAYIMGIVQEDDGEWTVVAQYTTSRPYPKRVCTLSFSQQQAEDLNQRVVFTLDAGRIAFMPFDRDIFSRPIGEIVVH